MRTGDHEELAGLKGGLELGNVGDDDLGIEHAHAEAVD